MGPRTSPAEVKVPQTIPLDAAKIMELTLADNSLSDFLYENCATAAILLGGVLGIFLNNRVQSSKHGVAI